MTNLRIKYDPKRNEYRVMDANSLESIESTGVFIACIAMIVVGVVIAVKMLSPFLF